MPAKAASARSVSGLSAARPRHGPSARPLAAAASGQGGRRPSRSLGLALSPIRRVSIFAATAFSAASGYGRPACRGGGASRGLAPTIFSTSITAIAAMARCGICRCGAAIGCRGSLCRKRIAISVASGRLI